MKTKVAINGFGRIGRNAFKIAFEDDHLEVVAVNDLTDNATLAYLLKHDSNYGTYQRKVEADDAGLTIDGTRVRVLAEKDPKKLPWKELGIFPTQIHCYKCRSVRDLEQARLNKLPVAELRY